MRIFAPCREIVIAEKICAVAVTLSIIATPFAAFAQDASTATPASTDSSSQSSTSQSATPSPDSQTANLTQAFDAIINPSGSSQSSGNTTAPASDTSAPATSEPAPSDTASAATPDTTTDASLETDQTLESSSPTSPSFASFGSGEPTSALSSVFTFQNTSPKVDGSSGALTQRVQLDIPPGRKGVQPDVALVYNSQNTQDSIVGYGWALSIPYIQRLNKTGSQDLYGSNPYYTSSIDGELATSSTTTPNAYFAKVDDGSHNSYSLSSNTWTVYDKNGTRYLYGSTDQARQFATSSDSGVYTWMLEEIRDTNDNYVKYTYLKDGRTLYPYQITYTGHTSTDGPFTIDFATSTRPDPIISYRAGFMATTSSRISEVRASVSGQLVRKYVLTYGMGNNGSRSMLTGVQEKGYDDNNAETVLPAMTFGYTSTTTLFYATSTVPIRNSADIVADSNGNGVNDQTRLMGDSSTPPNKTAWMFEDQARYPSLSAPPDYWAASGTPPTPQERGVRYLDINADGKADLVRNATGTPYMWVNGYSTSTGYVWNATTTWTGTIPQFSSNATTTGIFGDVNGDGLPDFVQSVDAPLTGISKATYFGNGSAWSATTTSVFDPPKALPVNAPTQTNSQLIDINGDGLDDWVYSDATSTYALLNTGSGWESAPDSRWTVSTSTLYKDPNSNNFIDRGARFMDINGDGLPDFVRLYKVSHDGGCTDASFGEAADIKFVYLNTGSGWATSTAYTFPDYIYQAHEIAGGGCHWDGPTLNEYGNWKGNGQHYQDVLSTITYPRGGTTSVAYTPTVNIAFNDDLPVSLLVVTSVANADGHSGINATTTYSYTGGRMYLAAGPPERKFAGFATTTETRANAIIKTYYNQGNNAATGAGEQSDGYAQINHPFRKDVTSTSGTIIQKTFYRWDTVAHGNSTFVGLGRQMVQDFVSDGTHRDKATDYSYSTTTDDVIEADQYGEVTGSSDGTFSDTGTDKRMTVTTYAASSSINMSVPILRYTLNNSSATSTSATYYYDSQAYGSVLTGNQTREEDWITGSTYASSTKTYNSFGLVATSTDRRGKATAYGYDPLNLYPATTTNPLSQQNYFTYNYSNGKVKQSTDPNGRISKSAYDGVGRVVEMDQSDLTTPSTTVTRTTFQFTDSTTTPTSIHRSDYLTSTSTLDTYNYFDGLDRLIQERKSAESTSTYNTIDHTYDASGFLASLSFPYFSSSTPLTTATSTAALYTSYSYDSLGRIGTTTNTVGNTVSAYSKWTAIITDANGHNKNFTSDAYGNLVDVIENATTTTYETAYTYDAANDLTKITDALSNVRNFTYDGLGNRLTAEDLHAVGDGTYGTWTYTYDHGGNVTSYVDPKSQTVNRTYDDFGRMLTEDYTGVAGTEVTYTYDSCTNGIGNLCTASSTGTKITKAYDILGRVSYATTTVGGIDYPMAYQYDRQGNITNLTYPNGAQVSYTINSAGLTDSVARKPSGGSWSNVLNNADYSPFGQIAFRLFANTASTTWTYDAHKYYRLTSIQSGPPSTVQMDTIAYSTSTTITLNGSGSYSGSFTTSGTNRLLLLCTRHNDGSGGFNGTITYGGVSLTRLATKGFNTLGSSANWIDMFYLVNPASGSNTLSVSSSAADGGGTFPLAVYTGVSQSGFPDTQNASGTDNGASWTTTVTPIQDNAWGAICGGSQRDMSAGSGTTKRQFIGQSFLGDSNGVIPAAAAYSMTINNSQSTVAGSIAVSLAPAVLATSSPARAQDITYDYDPVGNITSIVDISTTTAAKRMTLSYDALNRLIQAAVASTTSGSDYTEIYRYDGLGNITRKAIIDPTVTAAIGFDNSTNISLDGSGDYAASYTTSGSNRLLLLCTRHNDGSSGFNGTISYGGNSLTKLGTKGFNSLGSAANWIDFYYLLNPAVGVNTLSISGTSADAGGTFTIASYDGAKQSGFADASTTSGTDGASSWITTLTTVADSAWTAICGGSQRDMSGGSGTTGRQFSGQSFVGDSNSAITPAGSYNMTINNSQSTVGGSLMASFAPAPGSVSTDGMYVYQGTGYANPDAVTGIGNGAATTTYAYDNSGNLIFVTSTGTTTSYIYDYANRLTETKTTGQATSTFSYDYTGNRVSMVAGSTTVATSTMVYPSKFYSIATQTVGATTYATTTEYVYDGDTLLATVDSLLINGSATGTPAIHYIHPDHLESTNVITDANGSVSQVFDYYPYGSTRVNTNTGKISEGRKYIGQFYDDAAQLSYLNARYYNPVRGQFLSQDPIFLALGSSVAEQIAQQKLRDILSDPQQLNSGRTMGGSNSGFASGWRGNTQSRAGSISQLEYLADPQMQIRMRTRAGTQ